jgi:hypothetical protein
MEPFEGNQIKQRQGRNGMTLNYIDGATCLHRLIQATDGKFSFRVLNLENTGDLVTALVELEIPGLGVFQQIGVQKVFENSGEDLVKGALTDGLKRCAYIAGCGIDLYQNDEQETAQTTAQRSQTRSTYGNVSGNGQRTTKPAFQPVRKSA